MCQVSATIPTNTVIAGAGLTSTTAGVLTDFMVTLFDAGNNQRTSGGDSLAVSIDVFPAPSGTPAADPFAALKHPVTIEVFDLLDGSYTVRYVVEDTTWTAECLGLATCN